MRKYLIGLMAILIVGVIAALPQVGLAGPPNSAKMSYGDPDVGSGCNFPCEDDASYHAVDTIRPGAVAISAGGTVEFDVTGFHQVSIYEPGTKPNDVEPNPAAFPFVGDPNGRIAQGAAPTLDFSFTFDEPGKYLVICEIAPHFEEASMWGWVTVK